MEAKIKNAYLEEITYQSRMLNNLKRWARNTITFSSFAIVLIMFGSSHLSIIVISSLMMIISIILILMII